MMAGPVARHDKTGGFSYDSAPPFREALRETEKNTMPVEITMPQQSDTMTEGTVVKWLKKEGDQIKAGEMIAEIETDKAVMEMESFEAGTLAAVVAKEGQKVPVGGVIAALAKKGEDASEIKKKYASGTPAPAPAQPKPAAPAATPSSQAPQTARPTPAPAATT